MGVVVYAYGSTSEVAWLFLLAYWLWALAIAGGLYAAWNARGLEATAELRPAEALFEGDEADLLVVCVAELVPQRALRFARDVERELERLRVQPFRFAAHPAVEVPAACLLLLRANNIPWPPALPP